MPPFELHIDIGPGRIAAHPQLHQAVVHPDQNDRDDNENDQEDDAES